MTKTFLTSDTHFGHKNMTNFLRDDGTKLRPYFDSDEMDEALIRNWNRVVSPDDKVYHLGDVAIPRSGLKCLARLNGRKVLIRGNHDIFKLSDYSKYFADIRGCHYLDKYILSHIPVHESAVIRYKGNIHGHTHYRKVLGPDGEPDPRYFCVCVEHTDYAPIEWTVVKKILDKSLMR